jgi:hypothetical protein
LERELLRQPAAPRDAEHVHPVVAEPVEKSSEEPGERGEGVGHLGGAGTSDARHVEAHHLDVLRECIDERLKQVEARADAVTQH